MIRGGKPLFRVNQLRLGSRGLEKGSLILNRSKTFCIHPKHHLPRHVLVMSNYVVEMESKTLPRFYYSIPSVMF